MSHLKLGNDHFFPFYGDDFLLIIKQLIKSKFVLNLFFHKSKQREISFRHFRKALSVLFPWVSKAKNQVSSLKEKAFKALITILKRHLSEKFLINLFLPI